MSKKGKSFEKLPYRNGVGIIVLNNENKIFVAKRIDNPKNFWQMPQGGVDKGENYYDAALRELKEETGGMKKDVKILSVSKNRLRMIRTGRGIRFSLPVLSLWDSERIHILRAIRLVW